MLKSERLMQAYERLQSALLVNGTVVFAEEVVEEFGSRPGNYAHDVHQSENDGCHGSANWQTVAHTYGLGDDFAEDD